jgi:hypothetical protein
MEGFRELHNNTVPKKHDSQNNTPFNITPLTHVSNGLYIECPPRAGALVGRLFSGSAAWRKLWLGLFIISGSSVNACW